MKAVTFTSTLSPDLSNWLKQSAKNLHTTKRQILEEALNRYKNFLKSQELQKSFQRAANDNEIIQMTEEGWSDYNDQIKPL